MPWRDAPLAKLDDSAATTDTFVFVPLSETNDGDSESPRDDGNPDPLVDTSSQDFYLFLAPSDGNGSATGFGSAEAPDDDDGGTPDDVQEPPADSYAHESGWPARHDAMLSSVLHLDLLGS